MMKFTFNIEKRHLYTLFIVIGLVGVVIFAKAATLNVNQPWHALQQVSTTTNSGVSVDESNNGLIDIADSSIISTNTLGIQNKPLYWDPNNPNRLCYDSSASCSNQQTLTCNVLTSDPFNTGRDDYSPDGCDNDCSQSCVLMPACQGDYLCPQSTKVYFTGGIGQPLPNKPNVCSCTCTRSTTATYVTATPSTATKKCATFVDS